MSTATLNADQYTGPEFRVLGGSSPLDDSRRRSVKPRFGDERLQRLGRSMQWSRQKLLPFRSQRYDFIRQYVGGNYGEGMLGTVAGTKSKQPVNFMEMVIDTYAQRLAARNPQYLISTKQRTLKANALDLETALNYLVRKLNLQREFKKCTKDALFLLGVMKVGICSNPTQFDEDAGQPFAKRVSTDDWVHDVFAREYEESSFSGNHYILTLDEVREEKSFDKRARELVEPMARSSYNEQGDPKVATLGPGQSDMRDADLYDTVALWDVLAAEGKAGRDDHGRPGLLDRRHVEGAQDRRMGRAAEWPVSPVGLLLGPRQRDAGFSGVADVRQRLELQPDFPQDHQPSRATEDATALPRHERRRRAADHADRRRRGGEDGRPDRLSRAELGRARSKEPGVLPILQKIISFETGNLELMMGAAAQSPTAEQDKMLNANSSARVSEMEDVTTDFARDVGRDLSWYLATDPSIDMHLVHDLGGGVYVPFHLTSDRLGAGDKNSEAALYDFEIAPYSMQPKTPQDRLNSLMKFLTALQPFMPLFQQQGIQLNAQNIARLFAKFENFPDLETIMQFAGPDQSSTQQQSPTAQAGPPKMGPLPPGPPRSGQAPRRSEGTEDGRRMD